MFCCGALGAICAQCKQIGITFHCIGPAPAALASALNSNVMPQTMGPLDQAESFQLDVSAAAWYDLWHTHLDWKGEGNASDSARALYLQALFSIFEKAISQTRNWETPSNIWVLFVPEHSEEDSLYVHTPNPNRGSSFPYGFEGVSWGVEAPPAIRPFLNAAYEVGVSHYDGTMYWVREQNAA
jgi:hypothetical protein